MTQKTKRYTAAAFGAALILTLIVVFVPQETLQRTLRSVVGAVNSPDNDCQVVVRLMYAESRTYEFRASISRSEAGFADTRIESFRQEYTTRAKKALAESQGYTTQTYGRENYKILSGVQVTSLKIFDSNSGRSRELWNTAGRRAHDDAVLD